MMTRHSYTRATAGRLITAVGLAGVIAFALAAGLTLAASVAAEPIETQTGDAEIPKTARVKVPSRDTLNDIIERPLFSASRRPFEPAVEEAAASGQRLEQKLSLKLVGTMMAGKTRHALLHDPKGGMLKVRQGQDVFGWHLDQVDHDQVRLTRGDEVEWLKMKTDTP